MNRIITLLFGLISCFSWGQLSEQSGLLWKIERDDLSAPSYLYGSFHTNDRRVFDWIDSTYIALKNCETIALEVDIFDAFAFKLFSPKNTHLSLKFDRNGKPYTTNKKASFSFYGDEDGMPQFLDAQFQQYCLNAGKELFPLETIESQLETFGDNRNLNYRKTPRIITNEIKEVFLEEYLQSDVEALEQLMRSSVGAEDELYQSIIVNRNYAMTDSLDKLIPQRKGVFCAVGAGHLGGSKGIIQLLRNKGYSVQKVNAGSLVNRQEILREYRKFQSYELINDTIGLVANFHGKPVEVEVNNEDFLVGYEYIELGQGNAYRIEVYPIENEIPIEQYAKEMISLPIDAQTHPVELPNGNIALEGISENYWEGITWKRVVLGEKYLFVLIAKGGNKFMNSPRPTRFFDCIWIR